MVLGSGVDLNGPGPRNRTFINVKNRDFGHFWPFSVAVADGFGVQGGFKQTGTRNMSFTKS